MLRKLRLPLIAIAPIALIAFSVPSQAFFGMMNPNKWLGGNNNDDDYYDDYGPGYGGRPYGYGGGPYGGGNPYGYGGSPYGGYGGAAPYGASPYGGYGTPGYYGGAAPYAAPAAPQPAAPASSGRNSGEIDALKRRIEELESQQRHQGQPSNDWPSAPAFRPMGQGY